VSTIRGTHISATATTQKRNFFGRAEKLGETARGPCHYQDSKPRLDFSAKDATDLATALKTQAGGLYRDVKVQLLTDREATVSGMKDGLFWLQKETTSRDLAVVFLAGHGVTDTKNQFWFLTHEADMSRLYSTAVSRSEIMDVLHDRQARKFSFSRRVMPGQFCPLA
jgi:Caspase domain